jgi:dTDP-4-dehydrorhamnose reductase
MRILLTGATGQIGSALAPKLARVGDVIAPVRANLDLAAPERIEASLTEISPDLIVNCAAYTAVDRAEDETELAFAINAAAPAALAAWAARHATPLLHFSTDYVFDGSGTRPWMEDDPPRPVSAYGRSKLAGEIAVRQSGAPHLVTRTSWVYAARGTNFLRTIAGLAATRPQLRVVADQIGAPTAAETLAALVGQMIEQHRSDLSGAFAQAEGLCHLTASGSTSWHGFACAVVEGLRERGVALACQSVVPVSSAEYSAKATRPLNSRLSLKRLAAVYGLTPPSWQAALGPVLDAYVASGPG